ncbi:hypothetical protein BC941DRAFT_427052 [Chlamydoabsidia padenii]|nr:hypothetical protein BC941DRAFT_427052 [Chlamydoabsidia padenii]
MDTKLASRLDLLADNTLTVVFERNRLKELGLNYDKNEKTIDKNLIQLHQGINTLEQQLSTEEQSGALHTKEQEDQLIRIQVKVDKLDGLLSSMGDSKSATDRDILLGNHQNRGGIRFHSSSEQEDSSSLENDQILLLQQRIMDDQDENLDHLSLAIGRQRELGLLIGDELDSHVQLIDETQVLAERTDERLRRAKRKLDYVGRKVKDNSKFLSYIGS